MYQPSVSATRCLSPGLAILIGWSAIFAQAAAAPLAAQVSPTAIDWTLFPRECAPPPDSLTVDCGGYGIFHLSHASGTCAAKVSGSDIPRIYSKPGLAPRLFEAAEPQPAIVKARKTLPPEESSMPCENGSCFAPLTAIQSGEPWIAELDWNNWHGWTVGSTITSVSGLPVVFYALDDPELETLLGAGVGDAHVLAQLCAVAKAIDIDGSDEPVSINMSFGRYFEPGLDPATSSECEDTLACQVAKVFGYLDQRGIALVAAAGNYRLLEFPASLPEVLDAGALDMASFAWQSQQLGSWESPRDSQIVVPGYGICLPYLDADGFELLWPAPAGSSYASALFTGWSAELLLANPTLHPATIDWSLSWHNPSGCYTLSSLPGASCNPVANEIVERVVSYGVETCWNASVPGETIEIVAPQAPLTASEIPVLPSLVEWISPQHKTSPAPDPCIPCVSEGLSVKARVGADPAGHNLVLDTSSSSPLEGGFFYDQLMLRIDEGHYLLLDRQNGNDGTLLDQLQNAEVASLTVQGVSGALSRSEQPSLIYIVCASPGDCFWTSIPILIKGLQ